MNDRNIFYSGFTKKHTPDWKCPTCGKGKLTLQAETLRFDETRESKDTRWPKPESEVHPTDIKYVYACLFKCSRTNCGEIVSSSGRGTNIGEPTWDEKGEDYEEVFFEYFEPKIFIPPLILFEMPKQIPEKVRHELLFSFGFFFVDPKAAANHARMALELLLDDLKVNRFEVKNRKRRMLSLHKRIELLSPKYEAIRELCFAIKWSGNAGSHSRETLSKENILDIYDIMSSIFTTLYDQEQKRINKLAKSIHKNRGPKR
ncbi:MAG: DUF4145 domain-containing protein [Candidatus Marinimicrobia bacterium]|nr:DUF4145 domain-containing protein [Candidatus Neomarinimicrobiota bacterium]MCF7903932.1 DUF4145 domain-containing protein [Candidatus Neomarinimicrobiota bacterium]